MDLLTKTIDVTKKTIDSIGGKKTNYKEEIREKRQYLRKLTQEFGMNVYSAFRRGERQKVDGLYEELRVRTDALNKEIHDIESRYLAREKTPVGATMFKTILISEKSFFDRKIDCEKCKERIVDEAIECRLDEHEPEKLYFHPDCFHCECSKKFNGSEALFFEGKPWCKTCLPYAEEKVLAWCRGYLSGFQRVEVKDFDHSFHDGIVFAALVRNWHPDFFDVKSIQLDNNIATLTAAFAAAERAGIPIILDPEYMLETDRDSILTQVSLYQRKFSTEQVRPEGKEIWNQHLTTHLSDTFCKADEYLKGKEHVIGGDSTKETEKKKSDPTSMTFDAHPSLVTGGKAYEVTDSDGRRTVREPVFDEPKP